MSTLNVSAAPHINSGATTHNVMRDVCIALLPACVAAVVFFGLKALLIMAVCVASAVGAEFLFNLALKQKQTVYDFSAVVTGLILALNLSTNVPVWQCIVGSVFAIVVVKCLFGGLGKNIVNPAIAARVFMLLAFTAVAGGAIPSGVKVPELYAGATPLVELQNGNYNLVSLLLGNHGGTIGETCAIALLLGYAYLVWRGIIKWYVPFAFVATVFGLYFITTGNIGLSLAHVLAGGLLFGAIFMATDYVTTPLSNKGKVVFCIGCGVITFAIRSLTIGGASFNAYPEGVSISILFMNLLTPLIEKWTNPKTLGGVK